jgi:hypothetical protein
MRSCTSSAIRRNLPLDHGPGDLRLLDRSETILAGVILQDVDVAVGMLVLAVSPGDPLLDERDRVLDGWRRDSNGGHNEEGDGREWTRESELWSSYSLGRRILYSHSVERRAKFADENRRAVERCTRITATRLLDGYDSSKQ